MSTLTKFKKQTESSEDYGPVVQVVDEKKEMKTSQYGMSADMINAFKNPKEGYYDAEEEMKKDRAYAKMHPEDVLPYTYVNEATGPAEDVKKFKEERGIDETKDDKSKENSDDGRTWAEKIEAAEKEEEAKQKQKEEEEEEKKRKRAVELAVNKAEARKQARELKEGRTTAAELRAIAREKEKAKNKGIGGKRTRHRRKKSCRTTRKNKRGTRRTTRKNRRKTNRRR